VSKDTNDLVGRLALQLRPVRRLPSPLLRAATWLALSASYLALFVLAHRLSGAPLAQSIDTRFVVEELATLATAGLAAFAAFCCVIPGYSRRIALLPLPALFLWVASLGANCIADWPRLGVAAGQLTPEPACIPVAMLAGVLPAVAMVMMLRRGAPLYPRATVALGALAVAALTNAALPLFHLGDVSIMVLVWDLGLIALLSALAGWAGPRILNWRRIVVA